MAADEPRRKTHRKHPSRSTRRRDGAERDEPEEAGEQGPVRLQTVEELREARLTYLAQSPEERRDKMKYIGEIVRTETTARVDTRSRRTSTVSRPERPETKQRRSQPSRVRASSDSDSDEYVYGRPEPVAEARKHERPSRAPTARKPSTPGRSQTRRTSSNIVSKPVEGRRTTPRRKTEPVRRRNSFGIDERNTPDRYARDTSCCNVC
jgi:hypothetical protein